MTQLTILHTNDLHGRFEQMTRIATLIARERAQAHHEGRRVLLFDAGDSSDRNVWESAVTHGRANFMMLEAMGYDAVTLGNVETYYWGRESLTKLIESVHFPVLAANLFEKDSAALAVPNLKSNVILEIEKLKVAVVGVTVEEASAYAEFGYRGESAAHVLREFIPQLHAQGVSVIIVLSHLGFEADKKLGEVEGVQIIIGGHSHTQLDSIHRVNQTAIVQTGLHGNFLGRLDLELDEMGAHVTGYKLLPCVESVPPDPTLSGMLELIRFEAEVVRKKLISD